MVLKVADSAEITVTLADEAATASLAGRLAACAAPGDVLALSGDLGVGKTCFARAFIHSLSPAVGDVPSPTFTLVQTYPVQLTGRTVEVWHFDFYRLKSAEEAYDLAIEEAFATGISLVEWPERIAPLLPRARLDLTFAIAPDGTRQVRLSGGGHWRKDLLQMQGRVS